MKNYTNINDLHDISGLIKEAISLKNDPFKYAGLGMQKTLIMLFFNSFPKDITCSVLPLILSCKLFIK